MFLIILHFKIHINIILVIKIYNYTKACKYFKGLTDTLLDKQINVHLLHLAKNYFYNKKHT